MTYDLWQRSEEIVRRSGLDKMLVIDADIHHLNVLDHLTPYMDQPWRRSLEFASGQMKQNNLGDRSAAGRIKRPRVLPFDEKSPPSAVRALVEEVTRLGIDYSVVFPNDLLSLGIHPQVEFEVAVARAYARWLTECVLPHEPRILGMLYLPFSDPEASAALIEEFGERPGVVGFMVTGLRYQRIHHHAYLEAYRALEERRLMLAFHSTGYWLDRPYNMFDTFLAAHALSFPMYNSMHLINLLLHGIPERFPSLCVGFFEAGAAVIPMLMARLDTVFRMRPSEAPLLKRLPSEYMREFYYTLQPIEFPDKPRQMRVIMDQIGRDQILYASDYPHWDFDMPNSITNLGWLSEEDKRKILAGNAIRAFGLDAGKLTLTDFKTGQGHGLGTEGRRG